ncbi:hypothetical protein BaRGS_00009783 [Batillaria attramentaria]|uniref:Decapping nuclease n=1 Tax=Batillaria attramentaria TaxID=370345 RepID=A0ABD0LHA8_9CAEN
MATDRVHTDDCRSRKGQKDVLEWLSSLILTGVCNQYIRRDGGIYVEGLICAEDRIVVGLETEEQKWGSILVTWEFSRVNSVSETCAA